MSLSVAQSTSELLSAEEILVLVPKTIKGFREEDSKSTKTRVGSITYTMCQRNFASGNRTVQILLFDYKEAPIMYHQAMRKWSVQPVVETDSLTLKPIKHAEHGGWIMYSSSNRISQVFMGVKERYYIMITGNKVDPDLLELVLMSFDFEKFPN